METFSCSAFGHQLQDVFHLDCSPFLSLFIALLLFFYTLISGLDLEAWPEPDSLFFMKFFRTPSN